MKKLNQKVCFSIFAVLAIVDAILLILSHLFPGLWVLGPWWTINAPGFVLVVIFGSYIPASAVALTCMMIGAGLFSSLVWSVLFGYVFRRKAVA